ncbi:MAG: FxLYD domain-containing protein, partial [Bifidobacteriaceae bacterium]|nr:FxLYD domain-containing protein [Bifidobacteriaceae bacterium]
MNTTNQTRTLKVLIAIMLAFSLVAMGTLTACGKDKAAETEKKLESPDIYPDLKYSDYTIVAFQDPDPENPQAKPVTRGKVKATYKNVGSSSLYNPLITFKVLNEKGSKVGECKTTIQDDDFKAGESVEIEFQCNSIVLGGTIAPKYPENLANSDDKP